MEHRTTPPPSVIDESKKYSVTVHTSRGDFVIALVQPKVAPETVNNFVYLAKNNFYEGLTSTGSCPDSWSRAATRSAAGPADPPTSCPTRRTRPSRRAARWAWRRAAADSAGRRSS